ncbi:unnamed protein product [Ixodes hexagonus]
MDDPVRHLERRLRDLERMIDSLPFCSGGLSGKGNWEWSDARALAKYQRPWVIYKPPDDATKALVYMEYLRAVLGQWSATIGLCELLVKTILLMPDPDSATGYLFPTVFSDTATTPFYTIPTEAERATDALLKQAIDKYIEAWTPPPSAPKRRVGKASVVVGPSGQRVSAPEPDPAGRAATTDEQTTASTSAHRVAARAHATAKVKKEIQTLLAEIQRNPPTTSTRSAQKMLSFMALVCSRLCVKTVDQVTLYFQMKASKAFTWTCNPSSLSIQVPVPLRLFLEYMAMTFVKGSSEQMRIHEYLVGALVYYTDVGPQDEEASRRTKNKVELLNAGCLTHLSANGLGLVKLLYAASKATDADPKYLLQCATDKTVASSGQSLLDFLQKYHGEQEFSWRWARLVDDENFRSLSLKDNQVIGSRFAALLAITQDNEGIWKTYALDRVYAGQRASAEEWARNFLRLRESQERATKGTRLFQRDMNIRLRQRPTRLLQQAS